MDARLRLLVLGDDGGGKHALVNALCGTTGALTKPSVRIAVRSAFSDERQRWEEYTVLAGGTRLAGAREAVARRGYDGVVLAHGDSDGRTSIRRVWAPLAMRHLGDAGSVHAAGRRKHVRALGVWNELRVLWRDAVSRRVRLWAALCEAVRLAWCGARLMAHEAGVWTLAHIDAAAERELLAGTEVPVAVVHWCSDAEDELYAMNERERYNEKSKRSPAGTRDARVLFHVQTGPHENADNNPEWSAFLNRCDVGAKDGKKLGQRRIRSRTSFSGLLPF